MRQQLVAALAVLAIGWSATASAAEQEVLHVLQRLTWGPRPGDVERVQTMGLTAWLERQLDPRVIDDSATERALADLPTLTMSIAQLHHEYPPADAQNLAPRPSAPSSPRRIVEELQAARMLRAIHSERQLLEVMVDFWANHFNVFIGKGELRWYTTAWEREVLRPHALGRFPDLLRATARHPAMLFYLDNWLSARPGFTPVAGPAAGRRMGLNENYARELMELHTLGVDGGYTQRDVTEVARAFTGWTIDRPRAAATYLFRASMHDRGDKTVLGQRLQHGGERDGEQVLDLLAGHPSTARFVATKLARRFVADDPPPALVERLAAVYRATGGDTRAMLRSLIASAEFRAPATAGAKIKKPTELVASAARATGARVDARGALALARAAARIGEGFYEAAAPTGHPDRAEAWVSPGALLARMNFAVALAEGRFPGVHPDLDGLVAGVDRAQPAAVLERLLATLLHGRASAATRQVLAAHLGEPQITRLAADDRGAPDTDVAKLAALVLGSPEFQRR